MNNKNKSNTTPQSGADKKSTSEKKLVQARLPFKVLSSSAETTSPSLECRKRKLSYSPQETISTPKQTKLITSSKLKENLDSVVSESILVSDDETLLHLEKDNDINTPINAVSEKLNLAVPSISSSQNKNKSEKGSKITIKLPLNSKKRRKKSKPLHKIKLEDSDSSEPEIVFDEINRLKKSKITNNISNTLQSSANSESSNVCEIEKTSQKVISPNVDSNKSMKENQNDADGKIILLDTSNVKANNASETIVEENSNTGANKSTNETDEILASVQLKKVGDKGNENDTKATSHTNKKPGDATLCTLTQFLSPKPLSVNENKSLNQRDINNCSPHTRKNILPNLNNKNEANKLENNKQKKNEIEKRKEREELKRKEREEKEELKRKEKEEKEELKRQEKEEKEELKRKEKEEKEELKRKEKEEREKKRLAEIEMKNEEKRQKDDEKRKKDEQKEEERRKREDEKRKKELEKEEVENKKRKTAEAFTKFFHQKQLKSKINVDEEQSSQSTRDLEYRAFMPFQVKGDMKLAPLIRRNIGAMSKNHLNEIITDNCQLPEPELYLNLLRTGKYVAHKYDNIKSENVDDLIIVADELLGVDQSINEGKKLEESYKAKYFQFQENRRPAYYGTWRKKSELIGPRRPFSHDKIYFEYDVDSDDEWEEEEPGESLHGSDDEKESEDEYEVDNEFFVPHGHLSDEEMQHEDETDEDNTPECQKAKLKILQLEFANQMKKKTEKIKPRLIGIVWVDENGNKPDNCPNLIWESLNKRAMILSSDSPLVIEPENTFLEAGSPIIKDKRQIKRHELPEELIVDLIRLVHGNRHKKVFLIHEFQAFIAEKFKSEENSIAYIKAVIKEKIDQIAKWTIVEDKASKKKKKKLCWIVASETLSMYSLENMSDTNTWNYILPPKSSQHIQGAANDNSTVYQNKQSKDSADIKIFTKNVPKKKLEDKSVNVNPINNTITDAVKNTVIKKRVPLLISVPLGQEIPETYKYESINSLKKDKEEPDATNIKNISENVENTCPIDVDIAVSTKVVPKDEKCSPVITNQNLTTNTGIIKNSLVKKRVSLLLSVPRGQEIPETYKNELITNFLKKEKEKVEENIKIISENT